MMQKIAARPFWARVALVGLGLYLLLSVLYTVTALVIGEPEFLIFVAISSLPAVIVAALIIFWGSIWAYVIGALLTLLGSLFLSESIPLGLSSPDSFFDFVGVLLGNVGLLIAFIGCVVMIFQQRSGNPTMSGSLTAVTLFKGVLAVIAVLVVMSGLLTVLSIDKVSAEDREGAALVTAKKTEWNTDSLQTSASGGKIVAKNSDPFIHTFTVKELDLDYNLKPGSERLIELEGVKAGSYEFICTIPGHESMKGTLTIR